MKFLILITMLFSSSVFAEWRLKNAQMQTNDKNSELIIEVEGKGEKPVLSIKDGVLQVEAKDLIIWPKIEKKIQWQGQSITLMAYQFSKESGRVRLVSDKNWPFNVEQMELKENANGWSVILPNANTDKISAGSFDERYLEQLLSDKDKKLENTASGKDQINIVQSSQLKSPAVKANSFLSEDNNVIKNSDSSASTVTAKSTQTKDPILGLVMRFAVFLTAIIAGLWGMVWVFRKGLLSRGKLGFLKNDQLVSVLSTTFIAPKRSLIVVRVNKQVFLLGSSEAGLNNLGEIEDVPGLLKNAEKASLGDNFDEAMDTANKTEKVFRLKEMDTLRSNEEALLSDGNVSKEFDTFTKREDREKITDQIKRKIKTLKALQ
jgi:flagellar biogenesis protein FliO